MEQDSRARVAAVVAEAQASVDQQRIELCRLSLPVFVASSALVEHTRSRQGAIRLSETDEVTVSWPGRDPGSSDAFVQVLRERAVNSYLVRARAAFENMARHRRKDLERLIGEDEIGT